MIERHEPKQVLDVMVEKLMGRGVEPALAERCAAMLVENSLDGIYSHGVNRFPRLVAFLDRGHIKPENRPTRVESLGAFERWDGGLGMGNTNAEICMTRAMQLAANNGIGCVALRNTNHWMRGASFGIQAAKGGYVGICWTNTMPNMPAWGGTDRRIGNNPLILSVPYQGGYVLVDGAMAQYSYGPIEAARLAGRQLPFPGGFDQEGKPTCDPAAIEKTWRVLPIGYWKGSSFSILLDMIVASLSGGKSVTEIGRGCEDEYGEYGLSQLFVAIKADTSIANGVVGQIIRDIKGSRRVEEGAEILYPSEKEQRLRRENDRLGIPVERVVWENILSL